MDFLEDLFEGDDRRRKGRGDYHDGHADHGRGYRDDRGFYDRNRGGGIFSFLGQRPAGPPCSRCNAPLAHGARFCADCGAPAGGAKRCSTCESQLAPAMRFCPGCGAAAG